MTKFSVPTQNEVSEANQGIFDTLKGKLGFVPNLYATFAHSPSALGDFLGFGARKSSLTTREKEVVNLIVSQTNGCSYCLSAHTAISKMNGFTEGEILGLRAGESISDEKLDALATFVRSAVANNSKPSAEATEGLFAAGYTQESIVDITLNIGEITVTNYLHGITNIPVDFPAAPSLTLENA